MGFGIIAVVVVVVVVSLGIPVVNGVFVSVVNNFEVGAFSVVTEVVVVVVLLICYDMYIFFGINVLLLCYDVIFLVVLFFFFLRGCIALWFCLCYWLF